MDDLPQWARLGRAHWQNTGARRPDFAIAPGPGQESVWDYPRPPALVADERRVQIAVSGTPIADTRRAYRVLETSHPPSFYLPRQDVDMSLLVEKGRRSRCEWKGEAMHYDVRVGDRLISPAAWSYLDPFPEFADIAGHLAFYAGPFECSVGGERVVAQAGGFYGGWITSELVGPFKGEPGSQGW